MRRQLVAAEISKTVVEDLFDSGGRTAVPEAPICSLCLSRLTGARQAFRRFIRTSWRQPDAIGDRPISPSRRRICVPFRLSHSRTDGRQRCRRRAASCGSDAILWVPQRRRDDVDDGRYGWGGPIQAFLLVNFLGKVRRETSSILREIREGTSARREEAAEEERGHTRAMSQLRSLRCMVRLS